MLSKVRRMWKLIQSHPTVADAAVAGVLSCAAVVSSKVEFDAHAWADPTWGAPSAAAMVAGAAAVVGPLVLRRRFPLAVLLACTAGFLVTRIAFESGDATFTAIALSLAVYTAASSEGPLWRNVACGASLLAVMAELWRETAGVFPAQMPNVLLTEFFALLVNFALFCSMWALGSAAGRGRRRNVELEHEREEKARRAVFDERVRIARDLHDVVAHHVSVMGVQAGAARVVMARDPDRAREALTSIEASSRQAVAELHRLLGFLRQAGDPEELAPTPGLEQVEELAVSMSDTDLTVEVDVRGERRPLPPTLDVSVYRIVQEALTNALKHSGGSRAEVRVRYGKADLEVEIVDDGRPSATPERSGGSLGLVGMRERAALHGGRLTAGPEPRGGFAVRLTLPTPEGAL